MPSIVHLQHVNIKLLCMYRLDGDFDIWLEKLFACNPQLFQVKYNMHL